MRCSIEQKNAGFEIRADGFVIAVGRDDLGNVFVHYSGMVPNRLKRIIEKHKHLFVTPELGKMLICNEISHL